MPHPGAHQRRGTVTAEPDPIQLPPSPSPSHSQWEQCKWERLAAIDGFTYGLLALGYEAIGFKIAQYSKFTPAQAAALAIGMWGVLAALAWRLLPGGRYMQYRTPTAFAVRLHLILLALVVPIIPRQPVPPLPELLYIVMLSGGWVAGLLLTAVFLPLHPLPHSLLCLAAAVVVPLNAASTCAAPFMQHPLSAARTASVLRSLQRLALPRPLRGLVEGLGQQGACQAVLTSMHYLWGVVAPTFLVAELQVAASKRLKQQLLQGREPGGAAGAAAEAQQQQQLSAGSWLAAVNRLVLYVCAGELVVAAVLGGYGVAYARQP